MSRSFRSGFVILSAIIFATALYPSSLQDWEFNVNGTDYFPSGGATLGSVPGLNSGAFNATTGQGTLTLTFNPGSPGSYYVGAFFFVPVGTPFYNEYGVVNGSPASGQTWQIDVPEYDLVSANHGTGTIIDNLAAGALNDTNSVPGTTTNYLNSCGANGGGAVTGSCNDFVSLATGFNFTLATNQEEIITFDLSSTGPGGFSVEDVHPVDGSNATASDIFLSGSAVEMAAGTPPPPPPPGTPEPATCSLTVLAVTFLAFASRKRLMKN